VGEKLLVRFCSRVQNVYKNPRWILFADGANIPWTILGEFYQRFKSISPQV